MTKEVNHLPFRTDDDIIQLHLLAIWLNHQLLNVEKKRHSQSLNLLLCLSGRKSLESNVLCVSTRFLADINRFDELC